MADSKLKMYMTPPTKCIKCGNHTYVTTMTHNRAFGKPSWYSNWEHNIMPWGSTTDDYLEYSCNNCKYTIKGRTLDNPPYVR